MSLSPRPRAPSADGPPSYRDLLRPETRWGLLLLLAGGVLFVAALGGLGTLVGVPFVAGAVGGPVALAGLAWLVIELLARLHRRGLAPPGPGVTDWLSSLTLQDVQRHRSSAEAAIGDVMRTTPMRTAGPIFSAAGLWRDLEKQMQRSSAARVGDLSTRRVTRAVREAHALGYPGVADRASRPDTRREDASTQGAS